MAKSQIAAIEGRRGHRAVLELFKYLMAEKPDRVSEKKGKEIKRKQKEAEYYTEDLGNGVALELVEIPGGKFMMGSLLGESLRKEKPRHEVTIQPFFMGKLQITQAQWRAIFNTNPSYFQGDDLPVEQVSWDNAVEFCQRLSTATVQEYRLPTEAEWEYACRAGTTTLFHFGETITTDLANYNGKYTNAEGVKGEYREQTTPVGYFKVANNFGLRDMHGNVWEWCEDDWHETYEDAPTNGSAWLSGKPNLKVIRGGSWYDFPDDCRSAIRGNNRRGFRLNNIGFRVVCISLKTT